VYLPKISNNSATSTLVASKMHILMLLIPLKGSMLLQSTPKLQI